MTVRAVHCAQAGLCGSGHEVKTVMVAGKVLMRAEDGVRAETLVANEAAVCAEAQVQAEEMAQRVASDPVHTEMALLEAIGVRSVWVSGITSRAGIKAPAETVDSTRARPWWWTPGA